MNLSICIPSWNRKQNLLNNLKCLSKQQVQPQHKIEIVIVDHGSTDGTLQAVMDVIPTMPFPMKIVRIPRTDWDAATPRNYAAKVSDKTFDALYFLDSDILLPPDRIERLIDDYLVDSDPNRVIIGPYHNMTKPVNLDAPWYDEAITDYIKDVRWAMFEEEGSDVAKTYQGFRYALACFGGSLMVNRSLFFRSGGYDESMVHGGEDGDYGLTLWECGAKVSMDKGLLCTPC